MGGVFCCRSLFREKEVVMKTQKFETAKGDEAKAAEETLSA
jgi:hypothetical protein